MSPRHLVLGAGFLLLLAAFSGLLWKVQVVEGPGYYEKSQQSAVQIETVPAARGKLLDRNGKILAQDTVRWVGTLTDCDPETLTRLKALCREEGLSWSGEGPLEEVTDTLMARVTEEGLTGITFSPAVTRQTSGTLAPHLLGRVGLMSAQEWEINQNLGYALNEPIGKDGAEAAFESLLRGVPGTKRTTLDRSGAVSQASYPQLPQPGKNVTLTLDKDLQEATQTALSAFLDASPTATGGAAVVLDVTDGGVLAMVSLPGYDTAAFSQDYETLAQDTAHPLMNRALQGLYAPGSTFKLVTAAAALEEGYLTPETRILDTGRYTYYKTPQPQCWLYRQSRKTHGLVTVSEAITESCNVFFYDAGRRVGIDGLVAYAHALGLGQQTGIELSGEATGVVASPDYTRSVGGTWYEGNTLSAAIGQENNRFTPLQLAHMTATLVGDGHRWQVHLFQKAQGAPGQAETLYEKTSLGQCQLQEENLTAIKEGMLAVTQEGSLAEAFSSLPVLAGAKTGSAQVAGNDQANAVLVAFAPYDSPQIALALVAEQGGSGAALGQTAAEILDAWFAS